MEPLGMRYTMQGSSQSLLLRAEDRLDAGPVRPAQGMLLAMGLMLKEVIRPPEGAKRADGAEAAMLSVMGFQSGEVSLQTVYGGRNWWQFRRATPPHCGQSFVET